MLKHAMCKILNYKQSIRYPSNFQNVMRNYHDKDIEVYVPGHGTLCSKEEIKATIDYLGKYFINK